MTINKIADIYIINYKSKKKLLTYRDFHNHIVNL